jgi:hypothetical protein
MYLVAVVVVVLAFQVAIDSLWAFAQDLAGCWMSEGGTGLLGLITDNLASELQSRTSDIGHTVPRPADQLRDRGG